MNNPFQRYDDEDYSGGAVAVPGAQAQVSTFVARVYGIMFIGVALTALTAWLAASPSLLGPWFYTTVGSHGLSVTGLFIGCAIAELAIWVIFLFGSERMNSVVAGVLFAAFALLNGVSLSVALLVYTAGSVLAAFLVTAGLFGIFALYGHFTQRDLTTVGNLCIMAFIGLLLASIVNIFLASNSASWIITYAFVLVFVGLIAWQAQSIRQFAMLGGDDNHTAIVAALGLYIQFINLLWAMLRILGRRD
jgi:hypothetical protein